MGERPYVLLSVATSVDGYLDDAGDSRLMLSNDSDWDRVDEVRSGVDAILVGAGTVRTDDPRLLVRSPDRRAARVARGLPSNPLRVTLTATGDLDPAARIFAGGALVYAADGVVEAVRGRLGGDVTVVAAGDPLDLRVVLADLVSRGVRRLMVEGGGLVHTLFLTEGLADELHLAIAPFFVGDPAAPRFAHPGRFPHRMELLDVASLGDVVVLRYLLGDRRWLRAAIDLSRDCPPSSTAFSVGAFLVDSSGGVISTGYSRETDPSDHAEEAALAKVPPGDPRLVAATLYSSLEPCTKRASRPRTCTELILAAGIRRVVIAWREPSTFVDCTGVETLRAEGVEVVEFPDLAEEARQVNGHLQR